MATTTKSLSATQMEVRYGFTEKTARLFMLKVREAMAHSLQTSASGVLRIKKSKY